MSPETKVQITHTLSRLKGTCNLDNTPRHRQESKHFPGENGSGNKGIGRGFTSYGPQAGDLERVRLHPPTWLPKASTSASPGLSGAVTSRGSTLLSATNVTFQESSTSYPLESLFPPGNQILFKALPTGQGKPDPTPDLCKKLVWGEQRRRKGGRGPSLRAGRGPGASWGPGWAPRAPLSAPEQRHRQPSRL